MQHGVLVLAAGRDSTTLSSLHGNIVSIIILGFIIYECDKVVGTWHECTHIYYVRTQFAWRSLSAAIVIQVCAVLLHHHQQRAPVEDASCGEKIRQATERPTTDKKSWPNLRPYRISRRLSTSVVWTNGSFTFLSWFRPSRHDVIIRWCSYAIENIFRWIEVERRLGIIIKIKVTYSIVAYISDLNSLARKFK